MDEEITQVTKNPLNQNPILMPRAIIGDFKITAMIGAGSSSQIYQAENITVHKTCALKLFHTYLNLGAVTRGRYVHVVKKISLMDNLNIAQIFKTEMDNNGHFYSTMPLVTGKSLRELLQQNVPLPHRIISTLLGQLCTSLAVLHSQNITHGRLHPGNILVGQNPQTQALILTLVDAGVWHLYPPINDLPTEMKRSAQDAIYISPELAKGQQPDPLSDIYSLTVILYQMLTGKTPFIGNSFEAILEQHTSEQPPLPSQFVSLPQELEETILKGLEKDPRKRISSVEVLLSALDPLSTTKSHAPLRRTPSEKHRILVYDESATLQQKETNETSIPDFAAIPNEDNEDIASLSIPSRKFSLRFFTNRKILLITALSIAFLGFVSAMVCVLTSDDEIPSSQKRTLQKRSSNRKLQNKLQNRSTLRTPRTITKKNEPLSNLEKRQIIPPSFSREAAFQNLRPEKILGFGTLIITTPSPNAQVYVNGKLIGTGSRVVSQRLPATTHRVHLIVDGKRLPHKDIQLEPNKEINVSF